MNPIQHQGGAPKVGHSLDRTLDVVRALGVLGTATQSEVAFVIGLRSVSSAYERLERAYTLGLTERVPAWSRRGSGEQIRGGWALTPAGEQMAATGDRCFPLGPRPRYTAGALGRRVVEEDRRARLKLLKEARAYLRADRRRNLPELPEFGPK